MAPIVALLLASAIPLAVFGQATVPDTDPDWEEDPYERARRVNEGDLRILATAPGKPAHHHVNHLTISANSLDTGWVLLQQCHYHLDAVPAAEIVYTRGRVRDIRVTAVTNIGRAEAKEDSVQLEDVQRGATLCIRAETRALSRTGESYVLRNGPFMRRFLDGYYPMRVTLIVDYPAGLSLVRHEPDQQPGVGALYGEHRLELDTWFEGILNTRVEFRKIAAPS
ncbi:MAG: hypothetical protein ABFS23_11235 [Pseudomonadota bacterium]